MYIALSILAELLFVSLLIILFYRLKSRFGLVPLYILLGANQYFQTILASSFYIKFFGELSISPGSIILFSSSLFAILFIYIKEGVRSTQILIMGIVLANLSVTLLATITNLQETVMQDIIYSSGTAPNFFNTNFWIFFVGTITLILDAIIIVILYEFLFTKVRGLNLFTRLLIAMLVVFNFDAIVFSLCSFWGNVDLENKIVSQLVSKSAVAVFFAAVLWLYLRYLDNDRKIYDESTVKKSNEDIFSILTYKGKFEKLQLEKRISDEQLQKSITDKTEELKNSVRRFTILSSVQELRVDKFSTSEQANEFLIKVKEAFETDVCTIHLLKKENFELLSAIGLESHEEETLLDSTTPFFCEIIQKKKYLAIEDTDKEQGIIKGRKQGLVKFNYKSFLGAPLLSGNKVIGILKIYSRTVKRIFTTIEIEHFQSVALQVAHTIENAQLYEQNEKHKEVLVKQIVARKKAIEETLKSIQRFELIGKASNDAVWEWNLETNEFWGNEIHINMYGLTKADPEPGDGEWKRRLHDEDRERMIQTNDDALASDVNSFEAEYRLYTENKGWIVVYGRNYIKRNEAGKAIRMLGSMMDITERKKVESEIKEKAIQLQTLSNNLPGTMMYQLLREHDGEMKFTYVSKSVTKFTGYTPEEVIQDPLLLYGIVNEEEVPKVAAAEEASFKNMSPFNVEMRSKHLPGEQGWVHIQSTPRKLADGRVIWDGIMTDITESKKAELKIKEANKRFEMIARATNDAVYELDLVTGESWHNETFLLLFNSDIAAGNIKPDIDGWKIKLHPDDSERVITKLRKTLVGTSDTWADEFLFQKVDGSYLPFYDRAFISRDETGKAVRMIGSMTDISGIKKAEEALKESESYLRTILDTEPECVKVLNSKGELLSMNPAGLAMIEADNQQQVLGRRMTELVDEKYRIGFNRLSKEVFNGNSGTFEFEVTGLKGSRRWLETHAVPLKDTAGKIITLLGVTRDITQRKKHEAEITNTTEQLRQLTSHLQTVREDERKRIAREIHDELGQQLTAIKMDTVWIDQQIPVETVAIKDKLQNMLELLDGSHQSVRKILNELRPAVLDDNGLLEALQWQGRQFTESTGTPMHFASNQTSIKLPQETAICIFRVYQEALTNIMRYAGAGKVLSSLNIINNSIILTIEDDGKGFDTGMAETKKRFGLLGMKERVNSLKGKFDLVSSPGKGTKIVISLPYNI